MRVFSQAFAKRFSDIAVCPRFGQQLRHFSVKQSKSVRVFEQTVVAPK